MDLWPIDDEEVALLKERVNEAGRVAVNELKERGAKGGDNRKRRREDSRSRDDRDRDDDMVEAGMPVKRVKKKGGR
jgi:ATP-dependent RNA helicase DDX47/RRP3